MVEHRCAAVLQSFWTAEALRRTIEGLATHEPGLDIYVLENHSPISETSIRPMLLDMYAAGKIAGFAFFEKNIINNTFSIFVRDNFFDYQSRYDYLLVSDGDIEITSPIVAEQMAALEDPRCGSVSPYIDIDKLVPGAPMWRHRLSHVGVELRAKAAGHRFIPNWSGFWMRMYRTAEFTEAVTTFNGNGFRVLDNLLSSYFQFRHSAEHRIALHTSAIDNHVNIPEQDYLQEKARVSRFFHDFPHQSLYNHDLTAAASLAWREGGEERAMRLEDHPLPVSANAQQHARASDHPNFLAAHSPRMAARIIPSLDGQLARPEESAPEQVLICLEMPVRRIFHLAAERSWIVPARVVYGNEDVQFERISLDLTDPRMAARLKYLVQCGALLLTQGGVMTVRVHDVQRLALALAQGNAVPRGAVPRDYPLAKQALRQGSFVDRREVDEMAEANTLIPIGEARAPERDDILILEYRRPLKGTA